MASRLNQEQLIWLSFILRTSDFEPGINLDSNRFCGSLAIEPRPPFLKFLSIISLPLHNPEPAPSCFYRIWMYLVLLHTFCFWCSLIAAKSPSISFPISLPLVLFLSRLFSPSIVLLAFIPSGFNSCVLLHSLQLCDQDACLQAQQGRGHFLGWRVDDGCSKGQRHELQTSPSARTDPATKSSLFGHPVGTTWSNFFGPLAFVSGAARARRASGGLMSWWNRTWKETEHGKITKEIERTSHESIKHCTLEVLMPEAAHEKCLKSLDDLQGERGETQVF